MPKCLSSWLRAYERWVLKEDDDEQTILKKKLLMVVYPSCLVVTIINAAMTNYKNTTNVGHFGHLWLLFILIVAYVHLLVKKWLHPRSIEVVCFSVAAGFIAYDYASAATYRDRAWPLFVLLVDMFLMCKVPDRFTKILVAVVVLWLTLSSAELTFRFGLFDLGIDEPPEVIKAQFQCDDPPCPSFLQLRLLLKYLIVFLLDFYITRRFAKQAEDEKAKMRESIKTAEGVAAALAAFDLDRASMKLQENCGLPSELRSAFEHILYNLESYRPFLPDALFEDNVSTACSRPSQCAYSTAPGADGEKVALVFTDIEGSTATWEAVPEAMRTALRAHNAVIRRCMDEYDGYEVKTIGDAFMIAFEGAFEAISFGLAVQEELLAVVWPEDLRQSTYCMRDDSAGWRGLRVRVGIHYGPVVPEQNPLTGRYDYVGQTANKAARTEAAGVGGTVAVTREALEEAGQEQALAGAVVYWEGEVHMKGVPHPSTVCLVGPEALAGRAPVVLAAMKQRHPERQEAPTAPAAAAAAPPPQLSPRLSAAVERRLVVTIGTVLLPVKEEAAAVSLGHVSGKLERVLTCLRRTGGTVVSMLGTRVTVGWNMSGTCASHFPTAMRFAALVDKAADVRLGLCSGEAVCGAVGTSATRFTTAVGPCVPVSAALCEGAMSLDTLGLCAALERDFFFTARSRDMHCATRPVGTCRLLEPGGAAMTIIIYQLNVRGLEHHLGLTPAFEPVVESWEWSPCYWDAFHRSDAATISAKAPHDPVLARVCSALGTRQHLVPPVHL